MKRCRGGKRWPGATTLLLALLAPVGCTPEQRAGEDAARLQADSTRADSIMRDSLAQRRRAYEQTRADACKQVYAGQNAKYSNVAGWKYDGEVDGCWVEYRYDPPQTAAQCDSMFPPEQTTFIKDRLLCHEGRYRTRF